MWVKKKWWFSNISRKWEWIMTRKWADQQEYVTRWKYVGAVPTFPQIHPAIIIESWICIWSRLTTPSFKTFFFIVFLISVPLAIHSWWTTSRFEQNYPFVFFIALKISISIHTESLYSPSGRQHNLNWFRCILLARWTL